MNYFLVKIIYRIFSGDSCTQQFDEQLRLVLAANETAALQKARQLGLQGQEVLINTNGKTVRWELIGIAEIHELNPVNDGAEVWSRITELEQPDLFLEGIRNKSAALRLRHEPHFLPAF
jgi:hypothetical protein